MRDTFDAEQHDGSTQDAEFTLASPKAALLHDQPAGVTAAVHEHDMRH